MSSNHNALWSILGLAAHCNIFLLPVYKKLMFFFILHTGACSIRRDIYKGEVRIETAEKAIVHFSVPPHI